MKGPLVQVDNLDDRKEIWCLLDRLGPQRLVGFLTWCCSQATLPKGKQRPRVSQSTRDLADRARWDTGAYERLRLETWTDIWMLANNYSFDLDNALVKLVEIVRRW